MSPRSIFFAVALFAPAATASDITIVQWSDDPHQVVLGPLRASFAVHARAAGRWFLGGTWNTSVTAPIIDRFEEQFLDATFGSLHYTYVQGGIEITRVYHSMSGATVPWPITGMTPRLPFDRYLSVRQGEAWAHAEQGEATAIATAPLVDDMPLDIYVASAEYKAIRSVERDIQSGAVASGGRAIYFTSRKPCQVCEASLRYFAQRYTGAFQVNRIGDTGMSLARRFMRERRAFLATLRAALPPPDSGRRVIGAPAGALLLRCPVAAMPGSSS